MAVSTLAVPTLPVPTLNVPTLNVPTLALPTWPYLFGGKWWLFGGQHACLLRVRIHLGCNNVSWLSYLSTKMDHPDHENAYHMIVCLGLKSFESLGLF